VKIAQILAQNNVFKNGQGPVAEVFVYGHARFAAFLFESGYGCRA